MKIKTLEQKRAEHAWNAVETFMNANTTRNEKNERVPKSDSARKYVIHAHKLPVRIMASGLGQAMAFLLAKKYCPELLKTLSSWCLKNESAKPDDLLQAIIKGDSEDLRRYTTESLAYLQWLVRFVEASGIEAEE